MSGRDRSGSERNLAEVPTRQYIAFDLGDQLFGVEITVVREIRQWTPTAEMPDQPSYGRGVLDIRGEIVPIYDLQARLGGPVAEVSDSHMVLILSIGTRNLGILVDAVSEIISIGPTELRPLPDGAGSVEAGSVTNLAAHGDRMIALLDCKALFGERGKTKASLLAGQPGQPAEAAGKAQEIAHNPP